MAFPATAVANEFLGLAHAYGEALTPMKIPKLVYFAHGWHLAVTGKPLISEGVQAWEYGPVIPSLYFELRAHGNQAVRFPREDGRPALRMDQCGRPIEEVQLAQQIIRKVWETHGGFTAARLSNASHAPDSPWSQIYREGIKSIQIPDDMIRNYFQKVASAELKGGSGRGRQCQSDQRVSRGVFAPMIEGILSNVRLDNRNLRPPDVTGILRWPVSPF